jgi:hypothetical protein
MGGADLDRQQSHIVPELDVVHLSIRQFGDLQL